jgi:UDPglucose--hexose-1-phosphate uridylyltransferase
VEFRVERLTARMLGPEGSGVLSSGIEVRFDPLTGHSSRILPDRGLMPANEFDLEAFGQETQLTCPFCAGRLEEQTPRLPAEIDREGRLRCGEAVLFSNLHAYSSHSSVSVYSPRLHYLPLESMTAALSSPGR